MQIKRIFHFPCWLENFTKTGAKKVKKALYQISLSSWRKTPPKTGQMWTKHSFPFPFNPIWRKMTNQTITSGSWPRCKKYRNTKGMQKVVFHFKNWENYEIIVNFLVKAHVISFPPMLHRWCPCCQLGWRSICIIHQKTWSRLDAQRRYFKLSMKRLLNNH